LKETTREVSGRRKNGDEFPIRISVSRYNLEGEIHYVGLIQDISEQINAKKRVDYLSTHDALTGLMNRREFERLLESLLSIPDTKHQRQVLCYIDVDQFKVINDTLGHIAGDDALKQIGLLIEAQLRESGTIARLGGDEFAVLLPDCSIERAQKFAYGLLQTISNFLFIWKDKSYEMGVSIGLAEFNPHSELGANILGAADVACLMAKEQGRNRIHVYHPGDADLIRHHGDMHLVSGITQALNEGRFHLYAQPIAPVNPASKEQKHYEVLVRMVDEKGDLVVPENFIPAAERYILMPAVDRWVINHLFSTQGENLRSWSRLEQGRGFLFAINLSGTSLSDEGFLSYIKRQFTKWDIPHDAVCFEVTETAAIANLARARELISNLKELGCYFALDDFGAGLSSFSYLKDLPVDYLKIDGSFVRHMTEDPVDYAMVESINQIGHILGLKTIAEWAEDNATLNQLRALNVDFAQGYGVGEPEPMHSFTIQ
jgi:diguanylate cyclase (GGDEF)-like protein